MHFQRDILRYNKRQYTFIREHERTQKVTVNAKNIIYIHILYK